MSTTIHPSSASAVSQAMPAVKSTYRIFGLIFVVGTAFWMIDQNFAASSIYAATEDGISGENFTVDLINSVGAYSAPSRALLGLLGFGMMIAPARGNVSWRNPVFLAASVVLAICFASTFWSVNPRVTAQKLIALLFLITAAAGTARQFTLTELCKAMPAIFTVYIIGGILVEISLGNFTPTQSSYRLVGTSHPNTMAVYASYCCLAATAFIRGDSKLKWWGLLLFGIGIATLLLTKSRTTMLALTLALSSLGYLRLRKHQRVFVLSLLLTLASFAGIVIVLQSSSTLDSLGSSAAMGRTEDVGSLTGRLPLWEELSRFIQQRPLLGHGYLGFWSVERVEYLEDTLGWEIPHAHNMYIDFMLDGGALGLLLVVYLYLLSMATIISRYRVYDDPAVAVAFAILVFAMIHGTGESLFKLPTIVTFTMIAFTLRASSLRLTD